MDLEMNLTKNIQETYTDSFKTLIRDIEINMNIWREILCSWMEMTGYDARVSSLWINLYLQWNPNKNSGVFSRNLVINSFYNFCGWTGLSQPDKRRVKKSMQQSHIKSQTATLFWQKTGQQIVEQNGKFKSQTMSIWVGGTASQWRRGSFNQLSLWRK